MNILCILLNIAFIKLFVEYLDFYPTVAKVVATVIIVLISYVMQTHFFFKIKEDIIDDDDWRSGQFLSGG